MNGQTGCLTRQGASRARGSGRRVQESRCTGYLIITHTNSEFSQSNNRGPLGPGRALESRLGMPEGLAWYLKMMYILEYLKLSSALLRT